VKIKGEHVARVSDVGTLDTGAPYMVMEFLEGSDLAQKLERSGPLPVSEAVDYIIQACEAIAEAHTHSIVHRDLKPANLFLTKRPDGSPLIKVLDFGISKVTNNTSDNLTRTTAAMGSALYMSPEQMRQTRSVDHRTDIYALGISLFELVAGRQPFYAETLPQLCAEILTGTPTPLRALRPDVSEEFAEVLARAYERDLGRRYASIAEFVIALAPFASLAAYTTIERVARMGGLPVPDLVTQRGSNPPDRQPSYPNLARPQSQPNITWQQSPQNPPAWPESQQDHSSVAYQSTSPLLQGVGAAINAPSTAIFQAAEPPQELEIRPSPVPSQIAVSHYNAPASRRAAEVFASSNITPTGLSAAAPDASPSAGKGGVMAVAAAIVSMFAIGGLVLAFLLRKPVDSAPAGPGSTTAATESVGVPPEPKADTSAKEVTKDDEIQPPKEAAADAGAPDAAVFPPMATATATATTTIIKPPPPKGGAGQKITQPPPAPTPEAPPPTHDDPLKVGGARKR